MFSENKVGSELDPALPPGTTDLTSSLPPDPPTGPDTPTDTGTTTATTTGATTGTPTGGSGLDPDAVCEAAQTLTGYLDPYQTAGDGRVVYCHGNHLNESDISSCLPHFNHATDVFPTTGCDS